MLVVAAPDKFKGTADAAAAAEAMASGVARAGGECRPIPMADGGEGTLDALGGANRSSTVTGPAGQRVEARWRLDLDTAVIEMAEAAGLVVAGGREVNDPLEATTTGVGELILEAIEAGATKVIVGCWVATTGAPPGLMVAVMVLVSALVDARVLTALACR